MPRRLDPDPFLAGLKMLARRELSNAQVKDRLRNRNFSEDLIEVAITRLNDEGALNDRRTATAFARQSLELKLRGQRRVLRDIQQHLGISRANARAAVDEVYADVAERNLVERSLDRRGAGRIRTTQAFRRLYHALLRQGFDHSTIVSVLKARATDGVRPDDE